MTRKRGGQRGLAARLAAGMGGTLLGAGLVAGTMALGACGAFGGRCPSPPGLTGDVYGGIATGLALLVAAPILAWRPGRQGALAALVTAVPVVSLGAYVLGRITLN